MTETRDNIGPKKHFERAIVDKAVLLYFFIAAIVILYEK